jgi:hypothetical protein
MCGAAPSAQPAGAQIDAGAIGAPRTAFGAEIQQYSFQLLQAAAPSGEWHLYAGLTFGWGYGTIKPRSWRQQLGVVRGVGKCRQHRHLVFGQEFDDRLCVLRAAHRKLIARRLDAKSRLMGAAKER